MVFNLFTIFTISSKYERSFSKAYYTIFAQKNNLDNDIIEKGGMLELWVSANIVILSAIITNIIGDKIVLDIIQISS